MKYRTRSHATMLAHIVRMDAHGEQLDQLLRGMKCLIVESESRMENAVENSPDDSDYFIDVLTEERQVIESLLGCCLVLCQTRATEIAKRVTRAAEVLEIHGGKRREQVLRLGGKVMESTALTPMELIDTAANFFKHSDEWDTQWDSDGEDRRRIWVPTREIQKKNIDRVQRLGLAPREDDNVRKLVKLLGVDEGTYDVLKLGEHVKVWQEALADIVQRAKELSPATPPSSSDARQTGSAAVATSSDAASAKDAHHSSSRGSVR